MDQPWLTEPNFAKWRDPATGLMCMIVRSDLKSLCGYVRVPRGKLRQQLIRYRQIDPGHLVNFYSKVYRRRGFNHSKLRNIEVHGGLTFSGWYGKYRRLPRGYWIGFDCGHAFDYVPGVHELLKLLNFESRSGMLQDTYRDFSYVKGEVTELARQLAKILSAQKSHLLISA